MNRFASDPALADFTAAAPADGVSMLVRRGYEAHAAALAGIGVEQHGEWMAGGRAPHPVVALPDGERAVVRRYRRGGAVRHLNRERYFRGHRSWEELRATERARLGGVRVPTPLAAAERRETLGYTATLATRLVPDAHELVAWLGEVAEEERVAVLREAGEQIGRMHAAGVGHPDLNLRNVLVAGRGASVYLLDFDRARLYPDPVPAERRSRDLRRMARSAHKLRAPISAAGWRALRDGYGSGWPSGLDLG